MFDEQQPVIPVLPAWRRLSAEGLPVGGKYWKVGRGQSPESSAFEPECFRSRAAGRAGACSMCLSAFLFFSPEEHPTDTAVQQ